MIDFHTLKCLFEAESIDGVITDQMNATDSNDTQCFIVSWNKGPNGTELSYSALPCMDSYTHAVCEVRVYTQTWYVWATTNWLQVRTIQPNLLPAHVHFLDLVPLHPGALDCLLLCNCPGKHNYSDGLDK